MAVMRPSALLASGFAFKSTFAAAPDVYPPRVAGAQHVPLWRCCRSPHRHTLKPGPVNGARFFWTIAPATKNPPTFFHVPARRLAAAHINRWVIVALKKHARTGRPFEPPGARSTKVWRKTAACSPANHWRARGKPRNSAHAFIRKKPRPTHMLECEKLW